MLGGNTTNLGIRTTQGESDSDDSSASSEGSTSSVVTHGDGAGRDAERAAGSGTRAEAKSRCGQRTLLELAANNLAQQLRDAPAADESRLREEFLQMRRQHLRIVAELGGDASDEEPPGVLDIAAGELAAGTISLREFVQIVDKDRAFHVVWGSEGAVTCRMGAHASERAEGSDEDMVVWAGTMVINDDDESLAVSVRMSRGARCTRRCHSDDDRMRICCGSLRYVALVV